MSLHSGVEPPREDITIENWSLPYQGQHGSTSKQMVWLNLSSFNLD